MKRIAIVLFVVPTALAACSKKKAPANPEPAPAADTTAAPEGGSASDNAAGSAGGSAK